MIELGVVVCKQAKLGEKNVILGYGVSHGL